MCHFVTATLPKTAPHAELAEIASAHGRRLRPIRSRSVEAVIGEGDACFLTTPGHCDCGTPLGAQLRSDSARQTDWNVEARKLLKKGRSAAKVERTLAQKRAAAEASVSQARARDGGAMAAWLSFIAEAVAPGKAAHMGLIVHMYRGALDDPIELAGVDRICARDVCADLLGRMREDVLYVFHR